MCLARAEGGGWTLTVEPVGALDSLLARLQDAAGGGPVALGVDFPVGLPRAYVARHLRHMDCFMSFLRGLRQLPGFLQVCAVLEEVTQDRPFYPLRGAAGMTRLSHAQALGLDSAADLSRACDKATLERPAGAPLFWTLGANQSGKAAISAWRDLLLPALESGAPLDLWPFQGRMLELLRPGRIALAETYPAEALRQLGLRLVGSKRRQTDRLALAGDLRAAMRTLNARPGPGLDVLLAAGFGADAAGEDRFDCVVGCLCVIGVLAGRRPDAAPVDPWIQRWEGWVLGQTALPRVQLLTLPLPGGGRGLGEAWEGEGSPRPDGIAGL